jgi:hypothetical protein
MIDTKEKVEYKMLAGPSLEPLLRKMVEQGEPLPNIVLTVAFVAVDESGEIKAHCVLQSLPVAEPMNAEVGYGEHLKPLFEMMKDFVLKSGAPRVLSHTSHPAMRRMLEREGAMALGDQLYDWRKDG